MLTVALGGAADRRPAADVNALVPFYAIGVFTGFSMAGFGMARYHQPAHGSRAGGDKLVINFSAGVLSPVVVGSSRSRSSPRAPGWWSSSFPVLVFMLIRLNREYRAEAAILEMFRTDRPAVVNYARHQVFVFVNSVDLAMLAALRYGRSLRADQLTAVHFVIDAPRGTAAKALG